MDTQDIETMQCLKQEGDNMESGLTMSVLHEQRNGSIIGDSVCRLDQNSLTSNGGFHRTDFETVPATIDTKHVDNKTSVEKSAETITAVGVSEEQDITHDVVTSEIMDTNDILKSVQCAKQENHNIGSFSLTILEAQHNVRVNTPVSFECKLDQDVPSLNDSKQCTPICEMADTTCNDHECVDNKTVVEQSASESIVPVSECEGQVVATVSDLTHKLTQDNLVLDKKEHIESSMEPIITSDRTMGDKAICVDRSGDPIIIGFEDHHGDYSAVRDRLANVDNTGIMVCNKQHVDMDTDAQISIDENQNTSADLTCVQEKAHSTNDHECVDNKTVVEQSASESIVPVSECEDQVVATVSDLTRKLTQDNLVLDKKEHIESSMEPIITSDRTIGDKAICVDRSGDPIIIGFEDHHGDYSAVRDRLANVDNTGIMVCNKQHVDMDTDAQIGIDENQNTSADLTCVQEKAHSTLNGHGEQTGDNVTDKAEPIFIGFHDYRDDDDAADSDSDSSSSEDESDSVSTLSSSSLSSSSGVHSVHNREKNDGVLLSSDDEKDHSVTPSQPIRRKGQKKTKGDLYPEDLPPIEELSISVDENEEMLHIGKISGIVGVLVVIQSEREKPALDEGTVIFLEERKLLGKVFEIFGPVPHPLYSIRFNTPDDIIAHGIEIGHSVYCAPKAEQYTRYVFVSQLRNLKGSDASSKDNREAPVEEIDFSDDNEEKRCRAKHHGDVTLGSPIKLDSEANPKKAKRRRTNREKNLTMNTNMFSSNGYRGGRGMGRGRGGPFGGREHPFGGGQPFAGHYQDSWPPEPQCQNFVRGNQSWPQRMLAPRHPLIRPWQAVRHNGSFDLPRFGHPQPGQQTLPNHHTGPFGPPRFGNFPEFRSAIQQQQVRPPQNFSANQFNAPIFGNIPVPQQQAGQQHCLPAFNPPRFGHSPVPRTQQNQSDVPFHPPRFGHSPVPRTQQNQSDVPFHPPRFGHSPVPRSQQNQSDVPFHPPRFCHSPVPHDPCNPVEPDAFARPPCNRATAGYDNPALPHFPRIPPPHQVQVPDQSSFSPAGLQHHPPDEPFNAKLPDRNAGLYRGPGGRSDYNNSGHAYRQWDSEGRSYEAGSDWGPPNSSMSNHCGRGYQQQQQSQQQPP